MVSNLILLFDGPYSAENLSSREMTHEQTVQILSR